MTSTRCALVLEQARTLADLTDAKTKADARIERLQAILEAFQRHRFGRKSEQLDPDQFELALEDIEAALGSMHAATDAALPKARGERPRKTNRGSLPAHLERIEQVVDFEEKACPCCGGALHQIGEDVVERLDVVPTTFRVLSPSALAMAAARARARSSRLRRRHGSSKVASPPRR